MDCYKLTIAQVTYATTSSRQVLIQLLSDLFREANNSQLGFMYQETDIFPKEYFFNASEQNILDKIAEVYSVKASYYPPNFTEDAPTFNYLGNTDFFPPKL